MIFIVIVLVQFCQATTIRSFHILGSSLGEAFLPNGDGDSSRQPNDQKLNDTLPINIMNHSFINLEIARNIISKKLIT